MNSLNSINYSNEVIPEIDNLEPILESIDNIDSICEKFVKDNFILKEKFLLPGSDNQFIEVGANLCDIIEFVPVEIFKYLTGDFDVVTDEKDLHFDIGQFDFYGKSLPYKNGRYGGDILKFFKNNHKNFLLQADIEGHGDKAAIYSYIINKFLDELISLEINLSKDVIYDSISILFSKCKLNTTVNLAHLSLVEIEDNHVSVSGVGQGVYFFNGSMIKPSGVIISLSDGENILGKNNSVNIYALNDFRLLFCGDGISEFFIGLKKDNNLEAINKFKKILFDCLGESNLNKFFKEENSDIDDYFLDRVNVVKFFYKFYDYIKDRFDELFGVFRSCDDVTCFCLDYKSK